MSAFLTFFIGGAVSGSLYAVLASGLVLTYASSGVFNFAYGGIAYCSAVIYYELHTGLGWPIAPAAIVAILVFGPLLGWALDRIMFRRLAKAGPIAQIVATIGLSIAIPAIAIFIVERLISVGHFNIPSIDNVVTPPGIGPTPVVTYHLFNGVTINTNQIAGIAAAAVCAVGLWLIVRRTRLGLNMRAVVDRRDLASLRGVNPDRTSSIAWMLSTMLAALTGVLAAPVLYLGQSSFLSLMLIAATAAVFARLRSIPIAFASAIGLGIVESMVAGYIEPKVTINGISTAVPYVLMFVGLLLLVTDRRRKAGTAAEESPPRSMLDEKPKLSRGIAWTVVVVGLIIYACFVADTFWIGIITGGVFFGLIFLSFTVVTGIGGMISLAQATFVTGGAMMAGLLVGHHLPFILALIVGTAVAAAAGALVSLPALRLGGLALALATIALALIATNLIFEIGPFINGQIGWRFTPPSIGPVHFADQRSMFFLALVLAGLGVLLVRNLQRSPSGRSMLAMRSSPVAAGASGISPMRSRLGVFTISAAIAGFGGVMVSMFQGAITPSNFSPVAGLIWLAVAVTFGVRRPAFAIVAGLVYQVGPQLLLHVTQSSILPQMLFGLGGIGLAKNPEGLSDGARNIANLWRDKIQPRIAARQGVPVLAGVAVAGGTAAVAVTRDSASTAPGAVADGTSGVTPGAVAPIGPEPLAAGPAAPPPMTPATPAPSTNGAAVPSGPPLLELTGIRTGYNDVEVLHGIDLNIYEGTLVGILGANGAGKSTLCSVISGLLQPWAGSVRMDGKDLAGLPPFRRVAGGLLLAPESRGIFADLTVEENLRILLPGRAERDEAYERFPVLGQRKRLPAGVLSGGEQQMLTLAPILVHPPRLLIADEPSLGLAPQIVAQVFGIFSELRSRGVTLIVVEEKVRDVVPIADHLVVVELGRIAWQGHPSEGDDRRLAMSYLGMTEAAAT